MVVLLVVYPFNVVELDAAAATHPHNVELGGNSTVVWCEMKRQQCIYEILVFSMQGIHNSHSLTIRQYLSSPYVYSVTAESVLYIVILLCVG